jgi:hypothetical protein
MGFAFASAGFSDVRFEAPEDALATLVCEFIVCVSARVFAERVWYSTAFYRCEVCCDAAPEETWAAIRSEAVNVQ